MSMFIGDVLQSARMSRGLSLREAAKLAGVDHAYIHRLETDRRKRPSEATFRKLAKVLHLHGDLFLAYDAEGKP